ncbi:MAG: beta-lactamase family protein [bacterium]|nr:beta-lactamase family protein [bacterium]
MKKIILICLTVLSSTIGQSQPFEKLKLDQYFDLLEEYNKGMGSISIYQDGKEVYQRSIGFLDVEKKVKPNADTKYRIGSISKTFTAVIVMQLVEEGKVKLDDKVSEFFPALKNAEVITIEQLLRHRSGIANLTAQPDFNRYMEETLSREELLEKIHNLPVAFTPGERAEYSNTNYQLLSIIIEIVLDRPYDLVLLERICEPYELNNTYYGSKISVSNNEAKSYTYPGSWQSMPESDMSIPLGAGGIVSTPSDVNKFYFQLFNGKILSDESVTLMTTLKDNYGMGLFEFPFNSKKAFGHTGGIDGFSSMVGHFRKDNMTITYIGNGVITSVNDILIAALSIYFGKKYDLPDFENEYKPNVEDIQSYPGIYATASMPLKITITVNGNTVTAQATGQPAFMLQAVEKHNFKFDAAGLKMEFLPDENAFILKQGGGEFKFVKDE